MPLVFTVNGFPTGNQAPAPADGKELRYHDVSIDDLYANGAGPSPTISFQDELAVLETVIKAWAASGNMFANILQPGVAISPSVASFVIETAQMVLGLKKRRVMSFQDWSLLLKPNEETRCGNLELNAEALGGLEELAGMSHDRLFQKWVLNVGFEDLIATMKIYVGDLAAG